MEFVLAGVVVCEILEVGCPGRSSAPIVDVFSLWLFVTIGNGSAVVIFRNQKMRRNHGGVTIDEIGVCVSFDS